MQHFPVTDINPAMAHARRVIGAFEEHQITGFGRAGRRTDVIESLGSQPAHIPAGVIDDPRNVARAIKGSGRRTATPHITFAVLLTGNPVNALGKGIQGGNGVSIVINSKFILCVPPFSLLVWINNRGSQSQPPGSSACTHAGISGIIRCK